jgi:lipoprotein-anchoring transpeptidase ErfK/SrfK
VRAVDKVQVQPDRVRTAAVQAPAKKLVKRREMNPIYLPQEVAYDGPQKPGTIVIDTTKNFLYLVEKDGMARRYGVGTGKPGFEWAGTHKVSAKREWPDWRPPAEMIAREKAKGKYLPTHLAGGIQNPLGARALYLGSTLYRIHGTNQPWTIGGAVSSGCIRMRNEDVVDLYERVPVGTTVVVM